MEGLARYIFEDALTPSPKPSPTGRGLKDEPLAARCGFTITDVVEKRTTLLLLRARYLLISARVESLLAEESLMIGFTGSPRNPSWLELTQAQSLLKQAEPVGDLAPTLKKMEIDELLANLDYLEGELEKIADDRAKSLLESHRRVRNITKESKIKVQPQLPMDILGVYVLQPGKKRI